MVTLLVAAQPVGSVYVIVATQPVIWPVTTPPDVTDAHAGLLLRYVPPVMDGTSVIGVPTHPADGPVSVGIGLTVTVLVPVIFLVHPVAVLVAITVYEPPVVCGGKQILEPVPDKTAPGTGVPPSNNW